MADLVLAVDVGSTWCKAAWLDSRGRMVAQGRAYTRNVPIGPYTTLPAFWNAFVAATQDANSHLPAGARPAAIGIACRALFGVGIDADGRGYWPSSDLVADRITNAEMRHAYSAEVWGEKNPFVYGYATSFAGILLWLRRNRPAALEKLRQVGALRDYIVYCMTGVWVTDPATGPNQYTWPAEVIELPGISPDLLPPIRDPHSVAGGLTPEASQLLGLPEGLPVVVGQHDGAAANLGVGAIRPNDGCFTLGTNFVFRGVTGQHPGTPSMGYWVAPGVWAFVGNIGNATRQFELMTKLLDEETAAVADLHRRLAPLAQAVPPGSQGLVIGPLPGEEAAVCASVRQAQSKGYAPGVIYRAILEAVALAELALVNRARQAGANPSRFVATGGGATNRPFLQILASLLAAPVEMGQPEGGIWGAGMAAAAGAGWYASLDEALAGMSTPGPVVQPDPDAAAFYRGML